MALTFTVRHLLLPDLLVGLLKTTYKNLYGQLFFTYLCRTKGLFPLPGLWIRYRLNYSERLRNSFICSEIFKFYDHTWRRSVHRGSTVAGPRYRPSPSMIIISSPIFQTNFFKYRYLTFNTSTKVNCCLSVWYILVTYLFRYEQQRLIIINHKTMLQQTTRIRTRLKLCLHIAFACASEAKL